jgi:aryl-alcohol dehydrogenase-like predicted oxidoreductase
MLSSCNISIGTAQFGMDYGINNRVGKPGIKQVARILHAASDAGVRYLDTARAYGESEYLLGRVGVANFEVTTKIGLSNVPIQLFPQFIKAEVISSIKTLRLNGINCVLIHDVLSKDALDAAIEVLKDIVSEGLVNSYGISIYSPEEIDKNNLNELFYQLPCNLIDRRYEDFKKGQSEELFRSSQLEIRSIFLQGLLCCKSDSLPPYFNRWRTLFSAIEAYFTNNGISAFEGCLAYISSVIDNEKVIIGLESLDQLTQIIALCDECRTVLFPDIRSDELALIDPRSWG